MPTGLPVAKTLIKYNCNSSEEIDEEEKEPINIDLTEQKTDPYNDENAVGFKWSGVQEEEDDKILLWLTSLRTCTNKLMMKFFQKSNWMIVWWMQYRT